jgi:hypothetical protein
MAVDISPFVKDAQAIQKETGIPASIILGQIMLESGGKYAGGLSGLAVQGKNLFGIKGSGTAGSIYLPTTEYVNGQYQKVSAAFRKYNSYYESMLDHAKLLSKERYAKHLANAKTVNDFAKGIKAGGYATDPNYVSKLLGVISSNNLNKYDSGNIAFQPLTGSEASLGGNTTGGGTTGGGSSPSPSTDGLGTMETIFFHVIHAGLLLLIFIIGVIFFFKAFPAVEGVASTVTPPAGKVVKAVSKARKVSKVAKGVKQA